MNVVIVGASSGIGRATALALARQSSGLVLAARDGDALTAVAEECRAAGAPFAVPIVCDITAAAQIDDVVATAAAFGDVDAWINAAAVLTAGRLPSVPAHTVRQALEIDVIGITFATRAALALFERQGRGVLVNLSSLLGLMPNPQVPVYCTGKFAVRGLTLAVQRALPRRGPVRVCLVLFGPVDTPIFTRAANYAGKRLRAIPPAASPERAAATIVSCIHRPRRVATTGVTGWLLLLAHRVAPLVMERIVAAASARLLLTAEPAATTDGATAPNGGEGVARQIDGGWRRSALRRRIGDAFGRWAADRRG